MTGPAPIPGVTGLWTVQRLVSVTDGDTLRLVGAWTVPVDDELEATYRHRGERGVPVRLITVDTPEKGEPDRWRRARTDLAGWLTRHDVADLRVEVYGHDSLSRYLGDVYDVHDRTDSATRYLIEDCGWSPYLRGLPAPPP